MCIQFSIVVKYIGANHTSIGKNDNRLALRFSSVPIIKSDMLMSHLFFTFHLQYCGNRLRFLVLRLVLPVNIKLQRLSIIKALNDILAQARRRHYGMW